MKRYNITVNGKLYDVQVEEVGDEIFLRLLPDVS